MKNLIRMTIVLGSLFTITAYAGPNDTKSKDKPADKKDTTATDSKDKTATPDPKADDKKDTDKAPDTSKAKDTKAPAKDKKTTN